MKKLAILCIGLMFLLAAGCGGSKSANTGTPEGVTKAYYDALKDGKAEVAYQYKKFDPPKTKEQFVQERKGGGMSFKNFTVGKAVVKGNTAEVPVKFKTGVSSMPELTINVQLVKENGWKITSSGGGGGMTSGGAAGGMPPVGGAGTSQLPAGHPSLGGNSAGQSGAPSGVPGGNAAAPAPKN